MTVFEGIEHVSAEGTSSRAYFLPGKYTVTIDKVFVHTKRVGGGKLFIVETTVNESSNPDIYPGEQRNWVQSISNDFALPRIKSFIGATMGLCPRRQKKELNQKVTTDICENAVGESNPLSGKQMSLECVGKKTQSGKDFTQAVWGVIYG